MAPPPKGQDTPPSNLIINRFLLTYFELHLVGALKILYFLTARALASLVVQVRLKKLLLFLLFLDV